MASRSTKLTSRRTKPKVSLFRYMVQKFYHYSVPPVLCNSFPKSGTHLLMGIVSQVYPFFHFRRRVLWHSLVRTRIHPREMSSVKEVTGSLANHLPGEIFIGHLEALPEICSTLERYRFKKFFIYRDLRDVVISLFFMWKNGQGADQWPRRYFLEKLQSDSERISFLISGWGGKGGFLKDAPETVDFPNVAERFIGNLPWLSDPNCMKIKYEDLLSQETQNHILSKMATYLLDTDHPRTIEKAVDKMKKGFAPSLSKTFRKGQTGEWEKYFDSEHKKLFKECAGEMLITLGYEKDMDW